MSEDPLGEVGREALRVLEILRRVRNGPSPADLSSAGCATAVVAIVAIVLMPFIGRALDLSGNAMAGAGLALLLVAVAGIAFGFLSAGRRQRAFDAEVDAAVAEILAGVDAGDVGRVEDGAVRLVEIGYMTSGPQTIPAYDTVEVARRLGDEALELVRTVERVLVESQQASPIFTARS